MPVVSGYRVIVYEEYEKPAGWPGLVMKQPPAPMKLYSVELPNKPSIAKLAELLEGK